MRRNPSDVERERMETERRVLKAEIERWKHRVDSLEQQRNELREQIRILESKLNQIPPKPKALYGS